MDAIDMSTKLATPTADTSIAAQVERPTGRREGRVAKALILTLISILISSSSACVPSRPNSGLYIIKVDDKILVKSVECRIPPGGFHAIQLLVDNGDGDEAIVWYVYADKGAEGVQYFELGTEPENFQTSQELSKPIPSLEHGYFYSAVMDSSTVAFGLPEIAAGFYSPDAPDVHSEQALLAMKPRTFGC